MPGETFVSNDNAFGRVFKFFAEILKMFVVPKGDATTVADVPKWYEKDGVIYCSVTSDGTSGVTWITRLQKNGIRANYYTKNVFRSPYFKPSNGLTIRVAILKGILFEQNDRATKKVCDEANKRGLLKPNAELACLIREKFTDEEIRAMGLEWIVVVHEPIEVDGDLYLLGADRCGDGCSLGAYQERSDRKWNSTHGFAFAVSQTQG